VLSGLNAELHLHNPRTTTSTPTVIDVTPDFRRTIHTTNEVRLGAYTEHLRTARGRTALDARTKARGVVRSTRTTRDAEQHGQRDSPDDDIHLITHYCISLQSGHCVLTVRSRSIQYIPICLPHCVRPGP